MSTEITASKEEKVTTFMANGKEVKLTPKMVMNFIAKGNKKVTEQEVIMFINLCKFNELNPFINEAYLIKFGETAQMVVDRSVYEKRAESTPAYEGRRAGLILQRGDSIVEVEGEFKLKGDILLGGWAEVHRSDRKFPFTAKVSLAEYDKQQSTWKTHPCTMIRKVAVVHALREAFPKINVEGVLDEEPSQKEIVIQEVQQANQGQILSIEETIELEPGEIIMDDEEALRQQAIAEEMAEDGDDF